jgi:hypothetical protein
MDVQGHVKLVLEDSQLGAALIRRTPGGSKRIPFTIGALGGYALVTDNMMEFRDGKIGVTLELTLINEAKAETIASILQQFLDGIEAPRLDPERRLPG